MVESVHDSASVLHTLFCSKISWWRCTLSGTLFGDSLKPMLSFFAQELTMLAKDNAMMSDEASRGRELARLLVDDS